MKSPNEPEDEEVLATRRRIRDKLHAEERRGKLAGCSRKSGTRRQEEGGLPERANTAAGK
ncbi:hypothetical protein E2C01_096473 [Portunus trituberculatus]|uniref:Uncharacterized protein n=1 Tax=Portunus trituberculatus TaxID=210409 RepID=A0A5B7K239_PORTR|nr:hypothetical protein [Portunus trituberculatus]